MKEPTFNFCVTVNVISYLAGWRSWTYIQVCLGIVILSLCCQLLSQYPNYYTFWLCYINKIFVTWWLVCQPIFQKTMIYRPVWMGTESSTAVALVRTSANPASGSLRSSRSPEITGIWGRIPDLWSTLIRKQVTQIPGIIKKDCVVIMIW